MIQKWADKQQWATVCPYMGIILTCVLFVFYKPTEVMFWALINIPLYLFHQTEEHYMPGGFKKFMNERILNDAKQAEPLTDEKIFWINMILVWFSFTIFGMLSFFNIGFGLCIVIFSVINCLTHIVQGIKLKCWNPGLVMASIQFGVSIYAAYFLTICGVQHPLIWWVSSVVFAVVSHWILIKKIMPSI